MTKRNASLIEMLRHSAPYINAYQKKLFVIFLTDLALKSTHYANTINDIGLLQLLGIRLVIVYGLRSQIEQALVEQKIPSVYHKATRITSDETLKIVKQTAGLVQFDITSRLSMRLRNTPLAGASIQVINANVITAIPIGINHGIDYGHTGKIRRIDCQQITTQLANNNILLLSPVAVSVTGESFNLSAEEIATEVAIKLGADKLIILCHSECLTGANKEITAHLLPDDAQRHAEQLMLQGDAHRNIARFFKTAATVCRNGVDRCHIISDQIDGALLQEIFSPNSTAFQISSMCPEQIRSANTNDIPDILTLIKPLEDEGILVSRHREQLEKEISRFVIIERNSIKIGCASLHPFVEEKMGEMACVVIHPDYRNGTRGDALLLKVTEKAKQLNLTKLFVLTTHSIHWFQERGFVPATINDLPSKKKQEYNYQRNSKVLILSLS